MKSRHLILVICMMFPVIGYAADPVTINLAGKQRMLTQKMSKEILLISLDIDKQANLKNLEESADLFGRTLAGLKDGDSDLSLAGTKDRRILYQLNKVEKLWQSFNHAVREIIRAKAVSENQLLVIFEKNLPLLRQMNKCVKLFENSTLSISNKMDPSLAISINLSGRQRMLTQKMTKEFLFLFMGFKKEENQVRLFETILLFDHTLNGLIEGDEILELQATTNREIRDQLLLVKDLWEGFKPLVELGLADEISERVVHSVYSKNMTLLKEMHKVVVLYEEN